MVSRARVLGQLGERDRVPVGVGDVHVADAVRVGLDRLVLDLPAGEILEELVEAGDGERDAARARLGRVRLDEEPGVLIDLPEQLVSGAKVRRSPEEPRVPIGARVEVGYGDTGDTGR